MTSSQNSDPLSPKTATLMVALDKLTLQMNQMQQHNQQQFERLQKSNEDVSVRLEEVKDERHLGTTCLGGIMMKTSMVFDQDEVKDKRSLGTTHLEEIRCGRRL